MQPEQDLTALQTQRKIRPSSLVDRRHINYVSCPLGQEKFIQFVGKKSHQMSPDRNKSAAQSYDTDK